MKYIFSLTLTVTLFTSMSQIPPANSNDYYFQIPEYPSSYSGPMVVARMMDGLGNRFYWATESLSEENLAYKPNDEARTIEETINHIFGLTEMVKRAVFQEGSESLDLISKRDMALENIRLISEKLKKSSEQELSEFNLIMNRKIEFPFWNAINGPIADALWHTGQIVSLRRSAGNPFNSQFSVFLGQPR